MRLMSDFLLPGTLTAFDMLLPVPLSTEWGWCVLSWGDAKGQERGLLFARFQSQIRAIVAFDRAVE